MGNLEAAVNSSVKVIRVSGLTPPLSGSQLRIEDELLTYRSLVRLDTPPYRPNEDGDWNVDRGVAGTTVASHAEDSEVVLAYPVYGDTPLSAGGGTLAEVLAESKDPDTAPGTAIEAAADGDTGGGSLTVTPGAGTDAGRSSIDGGYTATKDGAGVVAGGATADDHGQLKFYTNASYGEPGQILQGEGVEDGAGFTAWQWLVASAASAPAAEFISTIYVDTTAVTGGVYLWVGNYLKISGPIP